MKKEEIQLTDWHRILVGNAPWEFLLEVLVRSLIMYLILLVGMRLLGKRMSANVSIFEMGVMITLGAIISVPMQTAERGIIPGIVILACVIIFQRTLSWLSYKYKIIESLTQGDESLLIKDGVIDVAELERAKLSHEQLFAKLRGKKIKHLGQVKRAYLEASGIISIFRDAEVRPGLSILPARDQGLYTHEVRSERFYACKNCGNVEGAEAKIRKSCTHCGANDWDRAVKENEEKLMSRSA